MINSLKNCTVLHTFRKTITAQDYNRVRLALLRISNPLQLELTQMNCLEVYLTDKVWLCMDSCVDYQPIMAWTEFKISDRSALHASVECKLNMYHSHAGLVIGQVIESMGKVLQLQLGNLQKKTKLILSLIIQFKYSPQLFIVHSLFYYK